MVNVLFEKAKNMVKGDKSCPIWHGGVKYFEIRKPCMQGFVLCMGLLILTSKENIVDCAESSIDRNATADNTITFFDLQKKLIETDEIL